MGAVSDVLRRLGHGLSITIQRIGDMPVHCYRCHKESRLADNDLRFLYNIPRYEHTLHRFCHNCAEAIYAEYAYRCNWCGKRHNLATFPICAACQKLQYPREAKRVEDQNLRAAERGLPASLTISDWLTTLNDWKWSCWCCGKPFEALDHITPIARGGGTTADNCFPICRRCNSMKGASQLEELLLPSPRSPESHRLLRDYQRARWQQGVSDASAPPTLGESEEGQTREGR